jgi:hypothetical protein
MSGVPERGLVGRALGMVVVALLLAGPASAFEAFEGRLQAHGFFESQMRALSADYGPDWDVAQWYQVFNLELEIDILDETIGPIDLLSGYVRAEVRFDCVYSRGCGMFRSMNTYGDRAKTQPERLNGATIRTATGAIFTPFVGSGDPLRPLVNDPEAVNGMRRSDGLTPPPGSLDPVDLRRVAGFSTLAAGTGVDGFRGVPSATEGDCTSEQASPGVFYSAALCRNFAGGKRALVGNTDDAFTYVFAAYQDYRFNQINGIGGSSSGHPTKVLGPWLPKNFVFQNAALADVINPFDRKNTPVLRAATYNAGILADFEAARPFDRASALAAADAARGGGARPYRPIPVRNPGERGLSTSEPRGIYYPSARLQEFIDSDRDDGVHFFNLREAERAWNRGSSQQDEKELKEAYLDVELFDSRLWLRIGKQSIVWGKTELFRTTDQFNPQDLALASLPSLEESRIPLWAFRAVYSLYDVGPLTDVRLEAAFNYDQFESNDLGSCGEAFTPNPVCGAVIGTFAHSMVGYGIAGSDLPPSPWESLRGWEVGGRVEFRWDRFSFAITDFYGYGDMPTISRLSTYERNVDPSTGRPRIMGGRGPCTDGTQADCLQPGPTRRNDKAAAGVPNNALLNHHVNTQLYTAVCATTIGFTTLDATSCAQSIFGSTNPLPEPGGSLFPTLNIAEFLGGFLAGDPLFATLLELVIHVRFPLSTLDSTGLKAADAANPGGCTDFGDPSAPCGGAPNPGFPAGIGLRLSPEQEALLGCGPFYGTNCDASGLDLMNAEASALLQSFAGVEGTSVGFRTDVGVQPGTVRFQSKKGGPVCTFGNLLRDPDKAKKGNKGARRLPGCRGPGRDGIAGTADDDPGYNEAQDGRPQDTGTSLDITDPVSRAAAMLPSLNMVPAAGTPGHPLRQWATASAANRRRSSERIPQQQWQNELAALSWNFQMLTVAFSGNFDTDNPYRSGPGECSILQPYLCSTPNALFAVIGVQRNVVQAGGDGTFGRRTFIWQSGGEVLIEFEKRNVLGFSMDFAEDVTKTNWGLESTWIEGVSMSDANQFDGRSRVDEYNLTISVDRPTFINFLNANRTFFMPSQWFFQYRDGYKQGFSSNGPWNILGMLSVSTGYYQDRLLPSVTFVYDTQSVSGAALAQVTYRYNEDFSVSFGASMFMGREELTQASVNSAGPAGNRQGKHAYQDGTENGLAAVRDRDEVFLRLRYTF